MARNRIEGTDDSETTNGTTGNDEIRAFRGNDELRGDASNDILSGGEVIILENVLISVLDTGDFRI